MAGVNVGTARIVIVVALVLGGIAVLWNGFGDDGASASGPGGVGGTQEQSPSPSVSTSPTLEPPRETPSPQVEGVLVQVFNGTYEAGLAGEVQQLLERDGYVAAADADDAPSKPVPKTTVYYRRGPDRAQNKSDARYLADTYVEGAKVARLDPAELTVADSVNVAIILGLDYAQAQTNG
jgi:LytR cell envelope-related transcriptional attenuator